MRKREINSIPLNRNRLRLDFVWIVYMCGNLTKPNLIKHSLGLCIRSEVWRSSSSELNDELDQSDPNVFDDDDDAASAAAVAADDDDDDDDNVEIDETVPIERHFNQIQLTENFDPSTSSISITYVSIGSIVIVLLVAISLTIFKNWISQSSFDCFDQNDCFESRKNSSRQSSSTTATTIASSKKFGTSNTGSNRT
ncbi:hypothetical protein SSS_07538 [Sarcoptes scabiei]|uniref:Uncharacterized protein n=1 Tax=Sarcoptes scabiei TaxID=52283 RepID=A0A834VE65_SARSC|nr:hypothetical protein SSS_07538 [Sarcoptes scabiei]